MSSVEARQPSGDFGVLIERRARQAGDRPLVTWYDDALGQRIELSWKTFENWVAKTANLLVDELGLEPGDRVATMLDGHWQAPVVLAACWRAGVSVVPAGAGVDGDAAAALLATAGCAACFVHEDLLTLVPERFAASQPPAALVAVTGDLLGRGTVDLGRALPFGRVVPGMPDEFDADADHLAAEALLVAGPGGAGEVGAGPWTQAELLEAAADLGGRLGVGDADRLQSRLDLDSTAGLLAGLVLPLLRGAGVVLERRADTAATWRRLAEERVALAALSGDQVEALLAAGPPAGDLDLGRLRALVCPREAGGAALLGPGGEEMAEVGEGTPGVPLEVGEGAPGVPVLVSAFVPETFRHRSGNAET
jgi:uncharacterized protein (TIGR03089 family)